MTVRNSINIKFTREVSQNIIDAYRRAYNQILKLPLSDMQNIDTIINIISTEYDQSAVVNSDNMYSLAKAQYGAAIRQVQAQIRQQLTDYKYKYNRIDTDTLNILDSNNTLFVGKYFSNEAEPKIRAEMAKIITEQQSKADTANAIKDLMTGAGKGSYNYSKMLVDVNGTWARSIGKTNALEDAGITTYGFIHPIDDLSCDFCKEMSTKTYTVEQAATLRDNYLSIDTSDYESAKKQLEQVTPFITGTIETGFHAGGKSYSLNQLDNIPGIELPPWHPNCGGEIGIVS